jgi:hypothetical protein
MGTEETVIAHALLPIVGAGWGLRGNSAELEKWAGPRERRAKRDPMLGPRDGRRDAYMEFASFARSDDFEVLFPPVAKTLPGSTPPDIYSAFCP